MDEQEPADLPIFELPLAIVPGEQTPLHVFEPRYRRMAAHSLEQEAPFGIVFRDDAGARSVGCTVFVSDVLERYDDGRMDIVVRGDARFRVLDRFEAPEWPAAQVELIEDGDGPPLPGSELAAARAAFGELLDAVGSESERAAGAGTAYEIAAQIEMPAIDKQALLETTTRASASFPSRARCAASSAASSALARSPSAPRRTGTARAGSVRSASPLSRRRPPASPPSGDRTAPA